MENQKELLENLIEEGRKLALMINPKVGEFSRGYYIKDLEKYRAWTAQCSRFVRTYYPDELEDFKNYISEKTSPSSHNKIVGVLEAIKLIPQENPHYRTDLTHGVTYVNNIDVNQNQSQTQSQQIAIQLFLEAIEDELTGKQKKELKQIVEDYKDEPEKVKPKLLEKLESFGIGILSGIVGNILTNPQILTGFMGT